MAVGSCEFVADSENEAANILHLLLPLPQRQPQPQTLPQSELQPQSRIGLQTHL